MNQLVKFEDNSLSYLGDFLKKKSPKSILLVTSKNAYASCGAKLDIENLLKNYQFVRFFDFEENPKIEDVEIGVQIFKDINCDLIIAVGGGSVIDMGKLINFFNSKKPPFINCFNSDLNINEVVPMIAIPTTAGTGSEATHFAVVYVNNNKYSIANNRLFPNLSIVNAKYTYAIPKYIAASTGADALCQAFESMWAVGGNLESKRYALKAIELLWGNLELAVVENDFEAKNNVSIGSYWAGRAIDISKTTASHALSYKITSNFGIPHGHAVAITLTKIMQLNYLVAKEDIDKILIVLGVEDINEGIKLIDLLWGKIELDIKLSKLGIKRSDIPTIANCNLERLSNNPYKLNKESIYEILESVY